MFIRFFLLFFFLLAPVAVFAPGFGVPFPAADPSAPEGGQLAADGGNDPSCSTDGPPISACECWTNIIAKKCELNHVEQGILNFGMQAGIIFENFRSQGTHQHCASTLSSSLLAIRFLRGINRVCIPSLIKCERTCYKAIRNSAEAERGDQIKKKARYALRECRRIATPTLAAANKRLEDLGSLAKRSRTCKDQTDPGGGGVAPTSPIPSAHDNDDVVAMPSIPKGSGSDFNWGDYWDGEPEENLEASGFSPGAMGGGGGSGFSGVSGSGGGGGAPTGGSDGGLGAEGSASGSGLSSLGLSKYKGGAPSFGRSGQGGSAYPSASSRGVGARWPSNQKGKSQKGLSIQLQKAGGAPGAASGNLFQQVSKRYQSWSQKGRFL